MVSDAECSNFDHLGSHRNSQVQGPSESAVLWGHWRPPQVKRSCLSEAPGYLGILWSEVGKGPILASAPLNAGITSFANRSSCSNATFSGTPTERQPRCDRAPDIFSQWYPQFHWLRSEPPR